LNIIIFCCVTPCSFVDVYQRFGSMCCFQAQDRAWGWRQYASP
jgi:hypothetical protein